MYAIYQSLPWYIKNIYFAAIAFYIVWMLFFDRNNAMNAYGIDAKLERLSEQKVYFEEEIEKVNLMKKELFSTNENIEKFAREHYFMKKSNEDIFVIIEKEEK